MAEEDLLFGKNRHLFGGIEPSNMRTFDVTRDTAAGKVSIHAVLPADTVIDGQTLCTVAGAIIRRSTTNYPEDEFSGELVADIKSSQTFFDEDADITGTYYYAAFPYTTQGVYNCNPANRKVINEPRKYEYLYGFDLNKSDQNPATRITYPSDVDNAGYAPAKMNFSTGVFSYGGWPSSGKFMPKPCMLTFGGVVDHYMQDNNYSKKVDGSASKFNDVSFGGNAMMEWPKIYTKRWEENGVYHFRCSDVKMDDDWECWSNYDKNNREIPHFYTPIYFGSKDSSGRMRSISGQTQWTNTGGAQAEITAATACGANIWHTECLADRLLIEDLLIMMGKSTDGQETYGYGCVNGSQITTTGAANDKGLFWGCGSSDKTKTVKVFGMEHWWGNTWRRIAGWIRYGGNQKVKLTRGTKDGTTVADYNLDGTGYLTVANAHLTTSGFISDMKTESYGRIPCAVSGSSSTFECDQAYSDTTTNTVYYPFVGGVCGVDLYAGPFSVDLASVVSASYVSCGAALSCKPLAA